MPSSAYPRRDRINGRFLRSDPVQRFWAEVDQRGPDECWEWQGKIGNTGYGSFYNGQGSVSAHRYSSELIHGPIPEGMCVLHRCDNKPCVNPRHLYVGTQAENIRDRQARDRYARGSRIGISKLTEAQVLEIRARRGRGERNWKLAAEYGVTKETISHIVTRRTWRDV